MRRRGALLALVELELGFRLRQPGFLLFVRAQALGRRAGHGVSGPVVRAYDERN